MNVHQNSQLMVIVKLIIRYSKSEHIKNKTQEVLKKVRLVMRTMCRGLLCCDNSKWSLVIQINQDEWYSSAQILRSPHLDSQILITTHLKNISNTKQIWSSLGFQNHRVTIIGSSFPHFSELVLKMLLEPSREKDGGLSLLDCQWWTIHNENPSLNHRPVFPDSLNKLVLWPRFTDPLSHLGLNTSSITHLNLGACFNWSLGSKEEPLLPPRLTHLTLGRDFNQDVAPGSLPATLRFLEFGTHFERWLRPGSLPEGLEVLKLGVYFDSSLDWCLPPNLRELELSLYFNQPFQGPLPASLQRLKTSSSFNQSLEGVLPAGLKYLQLGTNFEQEVSSWPPALDELHLSCAEYCPIISDLPSSLRIFRMTGNFNAPLRVLEGLNAWPAQLEQLYLGPFFNQSLAGISQWPSGLITLQLGNCFNHPIQVWPPSLRRLSLGHAFCQSDLSGLPSTLQILTLQCEKLNLFDLPPLPQLQFLNLRKGNFGFYCRDLKINMSH